MSNFPVTDVIFQTANGFYKFAAAPGTIFVFGGDTFLVTEPDNKTFPLPRATPDPAIPAAGAAFYAEMESPGSTETTEASGVVDWIVAAGASVTDKIIQPKWVGKPGDTPPVVPGFPGIFTEANRVDGV